MDITRGLTNEEVKLKRENGEGNIKVESSTQTVGEIVKSNVFTYFNFVFLVLAVLLAIAGAWRDMLFLPVIIANTLIGIIQEIHSKKVLDNLSILNAPKTKVIRDGRIIEVSSDDLVLDDIVIFEAGGQIPADAKVIDGEISVNESLITGESDEIIKLPGSELLSGSFVVSGQAKAQLTKVGKESFVSKLTIEATRTSKEEQSEMIRSLNRLILVVGIIIIPIGVALFVQAFFYNNNNFSESISSMVAAVIGMIPEGLYLLASVAMAVSTVRLSKNKVLVHDMKCIETLARVNVLCVDKTGTITEPGMQVYAAQPLSGVDDAYFNTLVSDIASNQAADNATMEALKEYFTQTTGKTASKVQGFSSKTKYSGVVLDGHAYVIGAPEFVMREDFSKISSLVAKYSDSGFRVLVAAEYHGTLEPEALSGEVTPLGIIALSNPIRKGAVETFSYFNECGVEIKVISGDNPATVSAIAKEAGIENSENYIDASTLTSDQDYYDAVEKYTVFGRVTPDQKRKLIKAIKDHKQTVAMTGDGVNDVLALKDADCSVAMASGSDAASNASQLVLLDSDFSRMPGVVLEGRRVVNNIQRTASLFLVKNIFSMLLAIFSVILMLDYPLEPSQVSLISMFTIGIPSFVLALEPNKSLIKGKFLPNVFVKALPAGITDFIVVSGLVIFCREFKVGQECLSTSCTILVAIVGFMILYRIAQPMKKSYIFMIIALICGWLYCMLFISHLFAITSISRQCAMLMVVFAIITEPLLRYLSLFTEWIADKIKNIKKL